MFKLMTGGPETLAPETMQEIQQALAEGTRVTLCLSIPASGATPEHVKRDMYTFAHALQAKCMEHEMPCHADIQAITNRQLIPGQRGVWVTIVSNDQTAD